ncbi:peptidylprolyl isomerase [Treponema sp.]|uniref:FKBP-type peptidyl-prolyl cis-trans isomerase n=1 Tax=Treponema sp. TaxID=166 RepID=UPI0025CE7F35|nr:peptidylprolyl isomerase [Treponema sp.]MBR4321036.1 peptidylprolyl isomerase [Treponema sp.]
MEIAYQKMVKIHYTLKDTDGNQLDSSLGGEPLEYMHGIGSLIPGLEKELEGKKPGDKFHSEIEPALGYGEYDEKLVAEVPRSQFDANFEIEVGQQFQADTATGPMIVKVTKIADDKITVDGNHELAGKKLCFDVEVVDVRNATEAELEPFINEGGCGSCGGCSGCGSSCGGCGGC